MRKSWKVRRNIKKHTRKYNKIDLNAAGKARSVVCITLAVIFAMAVPVMAVLSVANVIFRVPDLYSFDMGRTVVADDIELKVAVVKKDVETNITNTAVGELISDYMLHKTDYFQLRAEYQGREKPVFSINDGMNMSRYRSLLDRSLVVAGLCLIAGVCIFLFLYRTGAKRALRNGYRGAVLIYMLMCAGMGEFVRTGGAVRDFVFYSLINVRPQNGDVLPLLFGQGYRLSAWISIVVISFVVIIVGHSVTRIFTKEVKMF
jgi:hypothetical protein